MQTTIPLDHDIMTSKPSMHPQTYALTDPAVDQCFLRLIERYICTVPAWQARILRRSKDLLLSPRWELSPTDQLKVANILWEHQGSQLESGYRLKEDLKRYIRCNKPADRTKLMQALIEDRQGNVPASFHKILQAL